MADDPSNEPVILDRSNLKALIDTMRGMISDSRAARQISHLSLAESQWMWSGYRIALDALDMTCERMPDLLDLTDRAKVTETLLKVANEHHWVGISNSCKCGWTTIGEQVSAYYHRAHVVEEQVSALSGL